MSYRCPLKPPHTEADGSIVEHPSRKACKQMGSGSRETPSSPRSLIFDAPKMPPAEDAAPESPKEEAPVKKSIFAIRKQPSNARSEQETKGAAEKDSAPAYVLSGKLTRMFWTTIISLGKGAVEFVDKTILKTPNPYDTSAMSLTRSEEEMVEEVMPNITTKILGWFGVKSERAAEAFVSGLVIFRIFGRIFLTLGKHYVDEARRIGKARKDGDRQREAVNLAKRAAKMLPAPAEKNDG